MGKSTVREKYGVRINEAFSGKYQKEHKRKECIRDVHKETECQAVKKRSSSLYQQRVKDLKPQPQRRKLCPSQAESGEEEKNKKEKGRQPPCRVFAVTRRNGEVSILTQIKRMSLPVLLLLSLWTVHCGGCDFDWESVKNLKTTIDSNPTGFRTVFPKNYHVVHHYRESMFCDDNPCCVFPAAVVLLDSWEILLRNLWDEHLNHSLIRDIKQTLDQIIRRNKFAGRFLEEMDAAQLSRQPSSPEELLRLTSELFSQWLKVGCMPSIETCPLPTLRLPVERKDYGPSRARLLTTRGLGGEGKGLSEKIIGITAASGAAPAWTHQLLVWSLLLFTLCGWLLP